MVGGVSAAFSNLVLLGIPFMLGVFGQPGFEMLSLIISVHLPTMMVASIMLFELFGRAKGGAAAPGAPCCATFLRKLVTNPLIVGILAGLAWRLTGLRLAGAGRPASSTRWPTSPAPLALFAMGLGLTPVRHLRQCARRRWRCRSLKLMLMPAVALALAWCIGLPPLAAKVAVAAAALPSGVNSYLIATQFGTGQALASNQMTIATPGAVVTTAFWLAVAERCSAERCIPSADPCELIRQAPCRALRAASGPTPADADRTAPHAAPPRRRRRCSRKPAISCARPT